MIVVWLKAELEFWPSGGPELFEYRCRQPRDGTAARTPFLESWAESDLRLADVREVLSAHYNRRDSRGYSPVADMVNALDGRLQQLRVAAVNCGLIPSGAALLPETIGLIANKLIELGTVATKTETEHLQIDAITAVLTAGQIGGAITVNAGGSLSIRLSKADFAKGNRTGKGKKVGRKPVPLTGTAKKVAEKLESNPGLTSREVADLLEVSEHEVRRIRNALIGQRHFRRFA